MGRGGGPASVDGQLLVTPGGGPASWLDDQTLLVNTNHWGPWEVRAIDLVGVGSRSLHATGANALCAGGGRWLGWANGQGLFGSLGDKPFAGARGAGLDGTLGYCPSYQDGIGLMLVAPSGATLWVNDAVVYDEYALQILGPGQAVWFTGTALAAVGVPLPHPALTPGKLRRVEVAGEVWLVYQSDRGLIAQRDGALEGYVLEAQPITFNHDAGCPEAGPAAGELLVVWSVTQGEAPGDLRRLVVDRTQPRMALAPTPTPVVFSFSHPVGVTPFKAHGSGVPDLFTLGIYTEAETLPNPLPPGRLLVGHDAPTPRVPPAILRPTDLPLIEYYRLPSETLAQSVTRWATNTEILLGGWPGLEVGVIPMMYDQFRWSVGEILDGLRALSDLVNRSPRITVIAPFAYDRANGIVKYPELQQAFHDLVQAAAIASRVPGPIVPEEPPMPVAPNRLPEVQAIALAHPEINRMKEGPFANDRGGITQLAALQFGAPWGRKSRDGSPTNLSDDALCYQLPDGRFEIYDILSGGDGRVQWVYQGTFAQGQNGYFVVPAGQAGPGPSPIPPTPPSPQPPGLTEVEVRRIVQEELAKPRKVSLQTADGVHYVCAELSGGGEINATRTAVGAWETFLLEGR
jgi:hypothetical protein